MSSASEANVATQGNALYNRSFAWGFSYNFSLGLIFSNFSLYPLFVGFAGGGPSTIGLFMGLFWVSAVLGRPLQGALIDRYGPRRVLMLATACLTLPCFGFLFMLDQGLPAMAWVLRAVQGFGWGAHMSAFFTLVGQVAPKGRKNEAVAMYGMAGMIGSAMGPFMGEMIIVHYGWMGFFTAMIVFGTASLAIATQFGRGFSRRISQSFTLRSAMQVAKLPRFQVAFFFAICHAAAFGTFANFLSPVMTERGIESFTLFFAAFSFSGVTVRLIGGHWGDKVGYVRMLLPAFLLYGIGLLTLQISYSLSMILLGGVLCGAGHGLSFPLITTLGYVLAPKEKRGTGVALQTGMMDVGNGLSALSLGVLAHFYGLNVVFALGASAPFTAALMIALKGREFSQMAERSGVEEDERTQPLVMPPLQEQEAALKSE